MPKKGTMWVRDRTSIIVTSKKMVLFRTSYYEMEYGIYVDVYQTEHGSIVELNVE